MKGVLQRVSSSVKGLSRGYGCSVVCCSSEEESILKGYGVVSWVFVVKVIR